MDIYQDIRQVLIDNAETCYKNFLIKLIPNCSNILGVRIPFLRKIAKQICSNNWQSYIYHNPIFLEETLLQAIIIGKKSQTISDFNNIKNFIPKITNWAICDTFCSSLKFIKNNKDYCLIFLKPVIVFKLLQFLKAPADKVSIPLSNLTFFNEVQFSKI